MRLGLHSLRMHQLRRNGHHNIHANDNGRIRLSIVVTSWRTSGLGRRMHRTPRQLIRLSRCFSWSLWTYVWMLDCDGNLWTCFVWSLRTYVWMLDCDGNLCPRCEFVKFWICDCVVFLCGDLLCKFVVINLFWLRSVRPGVLATLWALHQLHHSVWCDWCKESCQMVWHDSVVPHTRFT
jgi:hypothetical protein